jgi:hypothetical protein
MTYIIKKRYSLISISCKKMTSEKLLSLWTYYDYTSLSAVQELHFSFQNGKTEKRQYAGTASSIVVV